LCQEEGDGWDLLDGAPTGQQDETGGLEEEFNHFWMNLIFQYYYKQLLNQPLLLALMS
jgi:hypothetical protein